MAKFKHIIPVILSGGSGMRLWPVSRTLYPKQFIPLRNNRSLFQDTVARVRNLEHGIQAPIIVCNHEHRFMAAEQLRLEGSQQANILLEPVGRNTAPAIALAALCAQQRHAEAIMLVLPADHIVDGQAEFSRAVELAGSLSQQAQLVTFGIRPTRAETGYGYIKTGAVLAEGKACKVDKFVEKPDHAKARQYVQAGNYLWNSGMFMFNAGVFLAELEQYRPDMVAAVKNAYQTQQKDLDFIRIDESAFAACKSESIDYAVMENTRHAVVAPLASGWNDAGCWQALWESSHRDESGNAHSGDVLLDDCQGCFVHSSSRLVTALGMRDSVIVETADAVMVTPRRLAQKVKNIAHALKQSSREEADTHRKVYRPWGNYESIDHAERFQVKRITVKPGERLSLQKHHHRAEHWIVVSGTAIVTCDGKEFLLSENQSTYIPIGTVHRLENPGKIPLELIEVQSGAYLGEDDIERFDDKYGRSDKC